MNWAIRVVLAGLVTLVVSSAAARAGSIWAKGNHRAQVLFTDDIARDIGDVLTVVIEEHSVIENETNRKLNKKSSRDYKTTGHYDILDAIDAITGKLFSLSALDFGTEATTDFDGAADYDSDRSVTDKITVTVEDVLPNGNLLVLGTRHRMVAGDIQIIQISGIVRPSDVNFDNEVSSKKVADFRLVYKKRGRENQFTTPGWLDEILNFINPF